MAIFSDHLEHEVRLERMPTATTRSRESTPPRHLRRVRLRRMAWLPQPCGFGYRQIARATRRPSRAHGRRRLHPALFLWLWRAHDVAEKIVHGQRGPFGARSSPNCFTASNTTATSKPSCPRATTPTATKNMQPRRRRLPNSGRYDAHPCPHHSHNPPSRRWR